MQNLSLANALVIPRRVRTTFADPAVRYALIVFVVCRIFLSLWAIAVLSIRPTPESPDEVLRPYLGEPELRQGVAGWLLGPWQRFDTMHYMRIARQGYSAVEDSVFPPLFPLGMRGLGWLFAGFLSEGERHILGGILVANLALIGALILFYRITAAELGESIAKRTLVYLSIFPTGVFLLAAYTETLFLLWVLGAFWAARRGRFWTAGTLGLMAALTRLTGWVLIVPLAYEYLRQRAFDFGRLGRNVFSVLLPALGLAGFLAWRQVTGLPPLGQVYGRYWHQTIAIPGTDLLTAIGAMAAGEAAFTLHVDFVTTFFLLATTVAAFRQLGPSYGLYSTLVLFFMLLPASELKPLFSFSRYALAFFPSFMVLGLAARNPWLNRLYVYLSAALYLYFSGQFFMWGWVA